MIQRIKEEVAVPDKILWNPSQIEMQKGIISFLKGRMPIKIEIDKEYFREKFQKVFEKWNRKFWYGIDADNMHEILEDLMQCFDEEEKTKESESIDNILDVSLNPCKDQQHQWKTIIGTKCLTDLDGRRWMVEVFECDKCFNIKQTKRRFD